MFNPRWMFHALRGPQIVSTQEELDALGDGWADSPQAAEALRPAEVVQPTQAELEAAFALAKAKADAEAQQEAEQAAQTAVNQASVKGDETPATLSEAEREVAAEIDRHIAEQAELLKAQAR